MAGIVVAFLLPVGVMMVAWGGLPPEQSRRAASVGLLALAISVSASAAAGFAFQYGGIWQVTQQEAYRALDEFWSVPDPTGSTWSVVGLNGFMLAGSLGPEVLMLFLHQLPLVIMATLIPMLALAGRVHDFVLAVVGIVAALVISPWVGHWVWGGGWLAALGQNLGLGHGYVDAAGAGAIYLAGGLLALLGLSIFASPYSSEKKEPQLPEAHLPLWGVCGAMLFSFGWMAWLATDPFHPASASFNIPLAIVNGLLAASAATVVAQLFSWLASSHVDPLMASRGWLAGWVVASAAAPFIESWSALVLGTFAGILVPISMYAVDHLMRLDDATAAISVFILPGLLGTLAVGLFADGRWGAGWNGIGDQVYLLTAGQGVTGLVTASGYAADSGQFTAQLAGAGAIALFALIVGGVTMLVTCLMVRAWPRRGPNAQVDASRDEGPKTDA